MKSGPADAARPAATGAVRCSAPEVAVGDPVGTGIVASLGRPGGNITGLSSIAPELEGKRLELLREVNPKLSHVAVFWNPVNAFHASAMKQAYAAAQAMRISILPLAVGRAEELDAAFAAMVKERAGALLLSGDALFFVHRTRLADLAIKNRLPSISTQWVWVEAGGLLSYAPSFPEQYRRAASYVDKILRGAKPADLPIEQPARFELGINLKTARALGLEISPAVLLQATEVIHQ